MEPKKWVTGGLVFVSILVSLFLWQVLGSIWDLFRWPLYEELVVPLPSMLAVAVGGLTFFLLQKNGPINIFLLEVVTELSKVTWPQRKETLLSSVIVLVMVGIAAVILFVFDSLWGTLSQKFLTL